MDVKYSFDRKRRVGKGSYGQVFKGYLKSNKDVEVAFKQIERDEDFFSKSAEKELEILKALKHHNIVSLLDDYKVNEYIYIVMEYCDSGNLEEFMKKQNPDLGLRLKVMHDCSKGVCFMHSQSPPIIHRDIKPQNVLMKIERGKYVAKLCDFGVSRALISENLPAHTDCGTLLYRAPELMMKRDDGKLHYYTEVDVFSLGLVYQVTLQYKNGDNNFEPSMGYSNTVMVVASVMVQCHLEGKEPPRLFATEAKEEKLTESIKSLVLQMTAFEASDRISIESVVLCLHKLMVEDGMNRQCKEMMELMEQCQATKCESCVALKSQMHSLKEHNSRVCNQMKDLERQIEHLRENNYKLRKQTDQLKCLHDENNLLKERNTISEGKITSLTIQMEEKIMEMAKLIDQVYILQQENGKQQAELSDHQSLLRQEKDETRKLRNQHKELLEQMDALKGTNTKQEQCIAALNKRFSRLNNDKLFTVTDLKRQLVKANVSLSKEQLENERLVSESMRLKDRIILLEESAAKIKAIDANQNDSNCSTSNDPQETDSEDNSTVNELIFAQDPGDISLWIPDDTSLYVPDHTSLCGPDDISLWIPDECESSGYWTFVMVGVICIGITKSSCGIAFINDCDSMCMLKWPDHSLSVESYETPTSILTDDDGAFMLFGYEAENKFFSDVGEESTEYTLFKGLDFGENSSPSMKSDVRATNGSSRRTLDILAMALKYLIGHLMSEVQKTLASEVDPNLIKLVVTLPSPLRKWERRMMKELMSQVGTVFHPMQEPQALLRYYEDTNNHTVTGSILLIHIKEESTTVSLCTMPWEERSWLRVAETDGENAAKNALINFLEKQLLGSHREKFQRKYKYKWDVDQIWTGFHDPICLHIPMSFKLQYNMSQHFGEKFEAIFKGMDGDTTFSNGRIIMRSNSIKQFIGPVVANIQSCAMDVLRKPNSGIVSTVIVTGRNPPLQKMVKEELLKVTKGIKVSLLENNEPLLRGALKCALDVKVLSS